MDSQDRRAIEDLFDRLSEVERGAGPRDADADAFIRQRIGSQPGAPYFMAQTIVMQNAALESAQRRIEELERQATRRAPTSAPTVATGPWAGISRGSSTGGSLPPAGAGSRGEAAAGAVPPAARRGGGFLAGAAQTAMGVAGGMLLGNALAGLFGGGSATAAEPAPEAPLAEEPAAEEGGGLFDGLFGDGGDEEF